MRDPYARLVSGWADLVLKGKHPFATPVMQRPGDENSFPHWAREMVKVDDDKLDHHFRPQHLELLDAFDQADLMHNCQLIIGKVEFLDTHLPAILPYVGGEPLTTIEHRRKSRHLDPSAYYVDDDLRARVHQKFWRDEMLYHKLGEDPYMTPPGEHPVEHFKSLISWDK